MRRWLTWLCPMLLFLSAGRPAAEEAPRAWKEHFLKTARVVSVKDVGEGATHPLKVTLEDGKVRMKAIFKSVNLYMRDSARFGGETVVGYIDSYKSELAAYELDRYLGLNALPAIVERRIKGKKGSLREWVEDVIPRYGHGVSPPDMSRTEDQMEMMWLFDYLIANVDRRTHNLMLGSGWRPVLIDHSMTFTLFTQPTRPLSRFPREAIDRLRALDEKAAKKVLGRYLKREQIRAFMQRRETVLKTVDRQVAKHGEAAVFYSMEDILKPH